MKRYGNLFDEAFSEESLYEAWQQAGKGKRGKRGYFDFSENLSINLYDLRNEIINETYKPKPYKKFVLYEPKERIIHAPAFRDVIVQHALYKSIYNIFNNTFIDQSYACRIGKGTHAAADYVQETFRKLPLDSYYLQMDIKKFFYSIDKNILKMQIIRKIKDKKVVRLLLLFLFNKNFSGIPIGNLLSQIYGLIYLNPLDHYIKRVLKAENYCRYVDDFIIFGWEKKECLEALEKIKIFIDKELNLSLSRYTLQKINKGINFVGYRTWKNLRLVRKHSLYTFTKNSKLKNVESIVSILGHAKKTSSYFYFLKKLRKNYYDSFIQLPKSCRKRYNVLIKASRRNKWRKSRNGIMPVI